MSKKNRSHRVQDIIASVTRRNRQQAQRLQRAAEEEAEKTLRTSHRAVGKYDFDDSSHIEGFLMWKKEYAKHTTDSEGKVSMEIEYELIQTNGKIVRGRVYKRNYNRQKTIVGMVLSHRDRDTGVDNRKISYSKIQHLTIKSVNVLD